MTTAPGNGDFLKKVQSGQPLVIPASAYNAFIDAAHDLQNRQRNQGRTSQASAESGDIVLVKNATGADQDRFAVLGIERPLSLPSQNVESFKNTAAFRCVVPNTSGDWHTACYVVLAEPIPDGAIGRAYINGVVPVRIYNRLGTGAFTAFAEIENNNTTRLVTVPSPAPAQILWRENPSIEGEMWAMVRLGCTPPTINHQKFDAGTTNAPFIIPASVIKITAVGGGGGGGSGGSSLYGTQTMYSTGGGGAAGMEIVEAFKCVVGETLTINVGSPGTGGVSGNGGDGGDTSVIYAADPAKLQVIARGGKGGKVGGGTFGGRGGGYASYGVCAGHWKVLKSKFGACTRVRGNPGAHGIVAPSVTGVCAYGGATEWGSPVSPGFYGEPGPGVGGNGNLGNGTSGQHGMVVIEW